jgi:hypothetical protein
MKRSKFTEEQFRFAFTQADAGQPVGDVCRQMVDQPPFRPDSVVVNRS